MSERPRFYGTDTTAELETIAEATLEEDGSLSLQVVILERATFATLTCGHDILWDDPDEDVAASFWCGSCGSYFRVQSFRGGGDG